MAASSPKTPLDTALAMLARRARSVAEIRRALVRKGFTESEVDPVIARLVELKYLDDVAWAARRAETLLGSGRMGPRAVERQLAAAGLEEGAARSAVEQAREGKDERELAARALARKSPKLDAKSPRHERVRAARWLLTKGFGEETVRALLDLESEQPPE